MRNHIILTSITLLILFAALPAGAEEKYVEVPAEVLWDKIRGGLLGQILGNLNGLEHEMAYINEPGNVAEYTPSLPEGAWTDDDTDFEWVYINVIQKQGSLLIPKSGIADLWRKRINQRIWCSNQYARVLMDLGIEPPLTGNIVLNPWADFNISGQFLCETFALLAPGMPQTAGQIGLHYTRITIDGEPAQSTQLFAAMIATAFLESDLDKILDAGVMALDPNSVHRDIVKDMRKWHRQNPDDWRTARRILKEKYSLHNGEMRDKNGYELNSASIIGALLYGNGDLKETLRIAFNFGWDADCNAATAGTIVGVMMGYRSMMAQGWDIRDRYKNTTRDGMPMDETITSFADRLIHIAERVILDNGGKRIMDDYQPVYRIPAQKPANVQPLPTFTGERARIQKKMKPLIEEALTGNVKPREKARAAYLAIVLNLFEDMGERYPEEWQEALALLNKIPQVAQVLYHHSPVPAAEPIKAQAKRAGLKVPAEEEEEWLWEATTKEAAKNP